MKIAKTTSKKNLICAKKERTQCFLKFKCVCITENDEIKFKMLIY